MNKETKKFYELKAEIIQAAAHPIRLVIIEYLSKGEQCVCDIVEHVGAQRSNVSRHLSVMVKAGVLQSRKEGLKVMYSLHTPCILKFLSCVEQVLKERIANEAAVLKSLQKIRV
jgi:ArsR family transcriptional regulator